MHTINSVKYYYKITLLKDPWSLTLSWSTTLLRPSLLSFPLFSLHRAQKSTVHGSAFSLAIRIQVGLRPRALQMHGFWHCLAYKPDVFTKKSVDLWTALTYLTKSYSMSSKVLFFYCCSVQMIANCDFLLWLEPELSLCITMSANSCFEKH